MTLQKKNNIILKQHSLDICTKYFKTNNGGVLFLKYLFFGKYIFTKEKQI